MRSLLLSAAVAAAAASSPVAGFRPPSVPIFVQSPEVNVWSNSDHAYDSSNTRWTGATADLVAAAYVNGQGYLLMGQSSNPAWAPAGSNIQTATQTAVSVWSTQTIYQFTAGGVNINMTWTTPMLTDDWDLLSRPAHYCTFSVASADGNSHSVKLYLDVNAQLVVRDPTALVEWSRMPVTGPGVTDSVTALRVGAVNQNPLADTNDLPSWGYVYLVANTSTGSGASMVLEYANTTRQSFLNQGTLPPADNTGSPSTLLPLGPPQPGTGPQVGIDRGGYDMPGSPFNLPSADYNLCWAACNTTAGCKAWAYGIPNCGGDPAQAQCWLKSDYPDTSSQSCRVSGQQPGRPSSVGVPLAAAVSFDLGTIAGSGAPATAVAIVAVDEILSLMWFGEACPPYWRRNLPVNSTTAIPMDMLADAYLTYAASKNRCDAFDADTAAMLSGVGGDQYATLSQLVYRQVFGASALVWVPSKNTPWYFLKEISSCGCLNTADVVYPAFPAILYYSPELMKRMVISHLEYAMNYTNQPYPLPWAPHHLGYWPIADLPYTNQENMPLEETAWDLLIIAAIGQRQNGDLSWLEPYWPAIESWYNFCVNLLPFPQEQLSTDDFDGPLYNATNLAMKGVASMAAYGYILETYKGDTAGAAAAYATAASYANTMVQYAWHVNSTTPSQSHFLIGYAGSQSDGGVPTSWPMLYNALWLRLLGYESLLPNQDYYLNGMRDWYAANVMQEFGLPLNSRKLYTKDDWMTFLAATYYTPAPNPAPSAFSSELFTRFFNWANVTTSRVPISDWTNTDQPTSAGFQARPVYGAMWAPVLVAQGQELGLGARNDPAVVHANKVFRETHERIAREQAGLA